jgi:hypothetical protein
MTLKTWPALSRAALPLRAGMRWRFSIFGLFSFIQLTCFAQVGGGRSVLNQLGFVHDALAAG